MRGGPIIEDHFRDQEISSKCEFLNGIFTGVIIVTHHLDDLHV